MSITHEMESQKPKATSYDQDLETGILLSVDDTKKLMATGQDENNLPHFMGEVDLDSIKLSKKGSIKNAKMDGTSVHEGELYPTTLLIDFPGIFLRGIKKALGGQARARISIHTRASRITPEQAADPNSSHRALYETEQSNER